MKKSTGYKEMLRDRCPKVVDFALKWCQAKERWLDLVYNIYIKEGWEEYSKNDKLLRTRNQTKLAVTRMLLGMKKGKPKLFVFDTTIAWKDLTEEEDTYWRWVSGWVRWFMEKFAYIENTYKISRSVGKSEFDCKVEIIQKFLQSELPDNVDDKESLDYVDRLVDYLVKCVESINKK